MCTVRCAVRGCRSPTTWRDCWAGHKSGHKRLCPGVATIPTRMCEHARCSRLMRSARHHQGFAVVPVNYSVAQAGGEILGRKAVAQVADCCGLEVVDIFNEENPYYMPM